MKCPVQRLPNPAALGSQPTNPSHQQSHDKTSPLSPTETMQTRTCPADGTIADQ